MSLGDFSSSGSSSASSADDYGKFVGWWCGEGEAWGPWLSDYNCLSFCFLYLLSTCLRIVAIPVLLVIFILDFRKPTLSPRNRSIKYLIQVCCSILLVVVYIAELIVSLVEINDKPLTFLMCDSIVGIVVWALSALVIWKEREKFLPHHPLLRLWWTAELFMSTLLLPTVIKGTDTLRFVDWMALVALILQFFICCMLLFAQEASYFTPSLQQEDAPLLHGPTESAEKTMTLETYSSRKSTKPNPLSFLTFSFITSLLNLQGSYKQRSQLDLSEISDLGSSDSAAGLSKSFQLLWEEDKTFKSPKLLRILQKMFARHVIFTGLLRLLFVIPEFVTILLMYWLLQYMDSDKETLSGVICSCLAFISGAIGVVLNNHYAYRTHTLGENIRSCVTAAVYKKCLNISGTSISQFSVGCICNYMAADAALLSEFMNWMHLIWITPVEIFVALILLLWVIGWSSLVGILSIVLSIPVNIIWLKYIQKHKAQMTNHQDLRGKLLNEVLHAIKTVKLMVWETHLHGQLNQARESEVNSLLKTLYGRSLMQTTSWATFPIVSMLTFLVRIASQPDEPLTSITVFVTMTLLFMITFPIIAFPRILVGLIQFRLALNRLNKFLLSPELDSANRQEITQSADSGSPAILIQDGTFQWEDTDSVALSGINLTVPSGQLVAVIGQVGSGKSSLLETLLGEVKRTSGDVRVHGSVAYVSQHAWVQNLSVRDNILFGKAFDVDLFNQVINACELARDISLMPNGYTSEIGEQGCNLSGGQKQRLSLARAVYQMADIYLLDDTLSAVDANVGQNIFSECFCGLLKGKTRIFVTQQFQYLNRVDFIYVMKQGTIAEAGTFQQLSEDTNSEFSKLYSNYEASMSHAQEEKPSETTKTSEGTSTEGGLVTAEEGGRGPLPLSVYTLYIKEIGVFLAIVTFLLFLLSTIIIIGSNFWLSTWIEDQNTEDPQFTNLQYIGIYAAIVFCAIVLFTARYLALARATANASVSVHNKALKYILQSPMSFFYSTPVGRIMNRFSEDLITLDDKINFTLSILISLGFLIFVMMACVTFVNPYFLSFLFPFIYLYIHSQEWHLVYGKELYQLEAITRSPIYATFRETLYGVKTIRSMKACQQFIVDTYRKLDNQHKTAYAYNVANRWLGFRIDMIGSSILGIIFLLCALQRGIISSSDAAMCTMLVVESCVFLSLVPQNTIDFTSQMVSLYRLKEYMSLPQEYPLEDSQAPQIPPKDWPSKGRVEFTGYTLQYRPTLPPALDNLSFTINPGEKVGIVGRTGAGKSSLAVALFRLEEAQQGKIEVDGIDISTISLRTLRSRLCLIPQDPVLFSGQLLHNLDVFSLHTEEELLESLETVNLKDTIMSKPGQLRCEVSEGGSNFSVGERQLICIARGLLGASKLIVLDEATANVDLATEEKIHNVIFQKCAHSTMLIIAHRTHTILQCDRVMMMERGTIIGFGPPEELLATNPAFASLIKKSDFKE
ncbi:multidrug resistance-associated protein 1 [Pelomyxa schiedti]|nr:multidrug resistance-associated protein 1 [Pelomyxa schiedti]